MQLFSPIHFVRKVGFEAIDWKWRSKMKKSILSILSLLLIASLFLFVGSHRTGAANDSEKFEEKIYSDATIDADFDGSSVLLVMDKSAGGINKVHDENFFGDFPKEYIRDLTEVTVDINEALIDWEEFRQILQIKLPEDSKENVLNVIRQLEKIEGIQYAGPDYFWYPDATTPNDIYFGNQWGLSKINAPQAWDITKGSSVKVGIIDTGIASHSDLNANLVAGWNFVSNNNVTSDTDGHGTHVAGIVGAVGNNSTGISGVNWVISLVPMKIDFIDPSSGKTTSSSSIVINAINYAKNNAITILNFSWGGFPNDSAFLNAINGYSGLFVCSAGNGDNNGNGYDIGISKYYPASWSSSGNRIITVGATNTSDARTTFSNFSATVVDLFAPGDSILSTVKGGGYEYWYGTSMAAPHVTGVAALMKTTSFYLDGKSLKKIINNTAEPVAGLNGYSVTGGILDANAALNYIVTQMWPCTTNCYNQYETCENVYVPACKSDCEQYALNVCGYACFPIYEACVDIYCSDCTGQYDVCMYYCLP